METCETRQRYGMKKKVVFESQQLLLNRVQLLPLHYDYMVWTFAARRKSERGRQFMKLIACTRRCYTIFFEFGWHCLGSGTHMNTRGYILVSKLFIEPCFLTSPASDARTGPALRGADESTYHGSSALLNHLKFL
mmetsp:Transcript_33111/g.52792  ORF Transcript_33111/g.52792 Transcript_33111/m.52792 type:complete len:135 (-) Transcript_33111:38-442(-)